MSALKFIDTDLLKPVTARVKVWDKVGVKGLYANKTPNVCSFNFRYYDRNAKKSRTIEIGRFDAKLFNCERARVEARKLVAQVDQKVDVAKAKRRTDLIAHNGTKTFAEIVALFMVDVKKDKESWINDERALARPLAAWGTRQITDITDEDIHALVTGILDDEDKPEMARNVWTTTRRLFRWAGGVGHKFITSDPTSFIDAEKDLGLPKANVKTRFLTPAEIKKFWHGLDLPDCPCDRRTATALKLILATAMRPSEVGLMRMEEIGNISSHEGGDGLPAYHCPADRVKLRREIVQPLSPLAQQLINEQLVRNGSRIGHNGGPALDDGPMFPYGRVSDRKFGESVKLNAHQLARILRSDKKRGRVGVLEFLGFTKAPVKKARNTPFAPFTPHDLRRTAATLLGLAKVSQEDIARVLDHQAKKKTLATIGVYDLSEQIEQTERRRPTLNRLGELLTEIVGTDSVIELKKAA